LVQQFISTKKLKQLKADSVLTQSVDYRRIEENDAYIWVNCFVKMYNDRTTNKLMARCSLKIIDSTQKEKDLLAKKIEMDELTGVYTRNTTEKMIGEYFNLSGHKRISALIVYDVALSFQKVMQIDGDKNDDMLKKVTEKVKIIFRNDDIVGRINNNKFVVFMKNIPERAIAMTKIKMMQEAISELGFSINIGVAFSEIQNETYQNIYEIADDCRVRAKNNGKNSFVTNENN
ncbi:MAG: diguanylate cyclase, partial [Oscillospiraceae bacterium]